MNWNIDCTNPGTDVRIAGRQGHTDAGQPLLYDVDVTFAQELIPGPVSLRFAFDNLDTYSVWSPTIWSSRHMGPNWQKRTSSSRLASGLPLHALVSLGGRNRLTVALSDASTATEIRSGIVEETAQTEVEIRLFTQPQNSIASYHITVYLDFTDRRYEDAIRAAEHWWRSDCGYVCAPAPAHAKLPMYSTWYSFHQNTLPADIVKQCAMAKEMGMESVIVDDGWQTDDNSRGYAYCGDWRVAPRKIPDMKAFVDAVHRLGMKFLLWYSVPFVGKHSAAFAHFSDMFLGLRHQNGDRAVGVLDPRFPEVRAYLADLYADAVRSWGLDGLKLDFIDSFQLFPDTPAVDSRRDVQSLDAGVDLLLREITETLRALNPEILIEFRQSYVGPTIRKYGNMLRVCDCPQDALINRRASADLRLVCGDTAVHSDMLMWNPKEPVESAAAQFIATLFCVPQVSVKLDEIPESHRNMLRFYLDFWCAHRDVLLNGVFRAENPEAYYSLVSAEKDGHLIAVAYLEKVLALPQSAAKLSFVNGSGAEGLAVRFPDGWGEKRYAIRDCMGTVLEQGVCPCSRVTEFPVPRAGLLSLF